MKIMKSFTILFLMLCLIQPIAAKKRKRQIPMNELTNPASPSYVPVPYPKTRKDVIEDLLYAVRKVHGVQDGEYYVGRRPKTVKIYLNLLEENPDYKVGKMFKVKNRHYGRPHEYSWIILIENLERQNVALIAMDANGIYMGSSSILPDKAQGFLKSEQDVLAILSSTIGKSIDDKKVKRIERMAFSPGSIGDFFSPAWEIELKSGALYYYSIDRETVYGIREKKTRKILKDGHYEGWRQHVPRDADDFIFDYIDDKIIVLKKFKKKKSH